MKHFCDDWIKEWCQDNGWTDLFIERLDYWAFPPHSVMPLPIPKETLIQIKAEKGFTRDERIWLGWAIAISISGMISSYLLNCPMPLVFAFAFTSVIVGNFELD
jgi:hypothetical protein